MEPFEIERCTFADENIGNSVNHRKNYFELPHSVVEIRSKTVNLINSNEEVLKSVTNDDTDAENSVHIIFVRGENDTMSKEEALEGIIKSPDGAADAGNEDICSSEGVQSEKICAMPSTSKGVLCSKESCDLKTGVSCHSSEKLSAEEVEDDFDVSGEVLFQVDQVSPLFCNSRKPRKKYVKECAKCGELVEFQDFMFHMKEHRRRKLKCPQNNSVSVEEQDVKLEIPISPSPHFENSTSEPSRTASGIACENNTTQSNNINNDLTDRPFNCSLCKKTFRTQSSLTIHLKSHSGESCSTCPVS